MMNFHFLCNGKIWPIETIGACHYPDTLSDGTPVVTMGGLTGIGVPLHFRIEYEYNWPELPQSRSRKMSEEEVNAFYKEYAEQHPYKLFKHLIKVNNPDGSPATASGIDE